MSYPADAPGEAIQKPSIIITSLGRTGTKFFAALFRAILPQSTALHEPDVINLVQYRGTGERFRQLAAQVREVGAYNLFVRRALGRWSLIALSDARVRGEMDRDAARRRVLRQRQAFVRSRAGAVYVEANVGYYGLIDILHKVYARGRVAYLVRDGREWVRSHMNWGQMYGKGRLRGLVAHTWPAASEIAGDPWGPRWTAMSRFERLCWAWFRLNAYALRAAQANPNARVFRFEEIFNSAEKSQHLAELVAFVSPEPIPPGALDGWLDRRIHRSEGSFPAWEGWPPAHKAQFRAICGPLMEELGYWG